MTRQNRRKGTSHPRLAAANAREANPVTDNKAVADARLRVATAQRAAVNPAADRPADKETEI